MRSFKKFVSDYGIWVLMVVGVFVIALNACSSDVAIGPVGDNGMPTCPKPNLDDVHDAFIKMDGAHADYAEIGLVKSEGGVNYKFEPLTNLELVSPSFARVKPDVKVSVYRLHATNKCGETVRPITVTKILPAKAAESVRALDKDGIERNYPTGYRPTPAQYLSAQYRDFRIKAGHTAIDPIAKEMSLKENVQRIFSQDCGDCWAQGAATAFETLLSYVDKSSRFISRQQIIDCSGEGSCGGGQISLSDFKKPRGAVYEADYKYKGNDQKCDKAAPMHEGIEDTFFVRDLTWSNLQRAVMEMGPLEVCGSAGALGNGGWVSKNPSGSTNHCYGFVGWYDGETHGKARGSYAIIANSWGTNWGDNGYGYYLMAKDGEHLDGDVITEAAGMIYKPACTPQPHADAGLPKSIDYLPGLAHSVKIGTTALPGHTYVWSDGQQGAEIYVSPTAAGAHTYTVRASTQCGVAESHVVVTVYAR